MTQKDKNTHGSHGRLLLMCSALCLVLAVTASTMSTVAYAATSGWKSSSGSWYYYDASGKKVTGWLDVDGKTYYLKSNGAMATGWQKVGGKWYWLDKSGALAKSRWIKSGNDWYHVDSSGVMETSWINDGGQWYYLKASGAMATGWQKDDGKWYYLNSSGAMAKSAWVKSGGSWYHFDNNGVMQTGWLKDGRTTYYLKSSGAMATGWQEIEGEWYYFSGDGSMAKSKWVGNYYLGSDGAMLTNTVTPDGYRVGSNGKWDGKGKVSSTPGGSGSGGSGSGGGSSIFAPTDWVVNDITRPVPKPDFGGTVYSVSDSTYSFHITYEDVDSTSFERWVNKVKASGFTVDSETKGNDSYSATFKLYTIDDNGKEKTSTSMHVSYGSTGYTIITVNDYSWLYD